MERILIIGASGFIGSAVTALAAQHQDWEVYALISGRRQVFFPPNVHVVTADLREPEQCDTLMERICPEIVLHLSWNLERKGFLLQDENLQWLEISLRLLRAFKKFGQGKKRFVFSGSSAEYGYAQKICKEGGKAAPDDLYGLCKLQFTNVANMFCKVNNMQFATVRYFSIYGPGESHLLHIIPVAIDTMLRGERFVCKAPNNVWDYVYIDDAAEATMRILNSNFCGTVNVGTGPVSMRELTTILAEQLGRQDLLVFENEQVSGVKLIADTNLLQQRFRFCSKIDIKTGLEKTVAWWKSRI